MTALVPEVAPVRPRVRGVGLESPRLLEEIVEEYADDQPAGLLWLVGQQGMGKSTALAHLSAVFQHDERYAYFDDSDNLASEQDCDEIFSLSENRLVIAARSNSISTGHPQLILEPWGTDELVEYLLAKHREECRTVMQRLGKESKVHWVPEIARIVLDMFLDDPNISDVESALGKYIRQAIPEKWQLHMAREFCLANQLGSKMPLGKLLPCFNALPPSIRKILRHKCLQVPLAAEHIANELQKLRSPRIIESQLTLGLVEAVAQLSPPGSVAWQALEKTLKASRRSKSHSMAASILHCADPKWCPTTRTKGGNFSGAYFWRVDWPGISFANAHLELAELFEANLPGACFDNAIIVETDFVQANLEDSSLVRALAVGADFGQADLRNANLAHAKLESANFASANLEGATLVNANLCVSDLSNTCLHGANLTDAVLVSAKLTNADFRACDLTSVDARRADFRSVKLHGACLQKATLNHANLEEVHWPHARLSRAKLIGAHLTGSHMPSANLSGANLSGAGLGEIDWENADLTDSDLSGATFHMGSSRSGLVDSPLACEGSRTGFYTDDLEKLYFKAPEEVRKANLRGADLRGANINHVDFYLVDLRDAKLDRDQLAQMRSTGAILSDDV